MIARGAGLHPPRTRQIGRDHAADSGGAGALAEQRPIIGRLESEFLSVRREQRFNLHERGAGLRRQHKLGRLTERYSRQT